MSATPENNNDFVRWYLDGWRRTFDYKGTSSRRAFWTFVLVNMGIMVLVFFVAEGLAIAWELATLLPEISLTIRRLRDIGRSPYLAIPLWICMMIPVSGEVVWSLVPCLAGLAGFILIGLFRSRNAGLAADSGTAQNTSHSTSAGEHSAGNTPAVKTKKTTPAEWILEIVVVVIFLGGCVAIILMNISNHENTPLFKNGRRTAMMLAVYGSMCQYVYNKIRDLIF